MIRNLKALSLALVAMLAFGAMTASSASAATDVFTSPNAETAWATGTSHNNVFRIFVGGVQKAEVSCTTAKFAATIKNNATSATALASYTGTTNVSPHTTHCNGQPDHLLIDMNHCHYNLTGATDAEDPGPAKDAKVWIQCPGTPIQITVTDLGVTVTIPSQTPTIGGVSYENKPLHEGGASVKVNTTVTGITWSCHPTFLCTLGGLPHHNQDARYTGDMTLTGFEDKDVDQSTETFTSPKEGKRVPISFHTVG